MLYPKYLFSFRFNILTGKYPFEGENIYRLFENIANGELVIPDGVEENLANLLKGKCCFYLNENSFEIIMVCHNEHRPQVLID